MRGDMGGTGLGAEEGAGAAAFSPVSITALRRLSGQPLRAGLLAVALASGFVSGLVPELVPGAAHAQDGQRLADIRADLATLGAQLADLRQEMVAGGSSGAAPLAGSALERMNALEAQLARLTARTEELQLRVQQVVRDGTNRLGDLEFRLCELEPGCDIAALGQTAPLGGGGDTAAAAPPAAAAGGDAGAGAGGELAVGEQADFDRAREVLGQGDFLGAAALLAAFAETYPGSPLSGEANYLRGEALMGAGDVAGAARAWLTSFSEAPHGARGADALVNLGKALSQLGNTPEACVTLDQVSVRYPGTAAASEAQAARSGLGCM